MNTTKSKHTEKFSEKASRKLTNNQLYQINLSAGGIDIGAKEIVVAANGMVRTFGTYTSDLKEITKWLLECNVDCVAMEATGIYWIPLYEILEATNIRPILVNTRNIKNVSGRKSDVSDAEWLATLLSYGLLKGAFRPNADILELRGYVRQRSLLIEHRSPHLLHMDKALIQMNLRLSNVISDLVGMSGMLIIRAIINGQRDPKKLAALSSDRCKNSKDVIEKSLEGHYKEEQVFALKQAVDAYDFYTGQIRECEKHIEKVLEKLECVKVSSLPEELTNKPKKEKRNASKNAYKFDAWKLTCSLTGCDLTKINGINEQTAVLIISEIGIDMTCWSTEKHFTSWLGLCPDNKISGGKILKSRTKRSRNKIRQALKLAAYSLHANKSALGAYFRRMRGKHGVEKAIVATAHKMARHIYRMLKYGQIYDDIGQEKYEKQQRDRILKGLQKKAAELGYELVNKKVA